MNDNNFGNWSPIKWRNEIYFVMPITPHASRPPAFPVVLLSSCPPFPKSSGSACTWEQWIKSLQFLTKILKSLKWQKNINWTYHNRSSNNIQWTIQRNSTVADVNLGHAISTGFNVSQISNMTFRIIRWSVFFTKWIEMRSCAGTAWNKRKLSKMKSNWIYEMERAIIIVHFESEASVS